jgi:hypothetical protein
MGRGSWDDPRARATCGLRRIRGSRQTVLLARRAPTIKRWSLDARSEDQINDLDYVGLEQMNAIL